MKISKVLMLTATLILSANANVDSSQGYPGHSKIANPEGVNAGQSIDPNPSFDVLSAESRLKELAKFMKGRTLDEVSNSLNNLNSFNNSGRLEEQDNKANILSGTGTLYCVKNSKFIIAPPQMLETDATTLKDTDGTPVLTKIIQALQNDKTTAIRLSYKTLIPAVTGPLIQEKMLVAVGSKFLHNEKPSSNSTDKYVCYITN